MQGPIIHPHDYAMSQYYAVACIALIGLSASVGFLVYKRVRTSPFSGKEGPWSIAAGLLTLVIGICILVFLPLPNPSPSVTEIVSGVLKGLGQDVATSKEPHNPKSSQNSSGHKLEPVLTTQSKENKDESTIPTLSALFKSDLSNVVKFTDEDRIGVQWKDGSVLHIKTQLYADFHGRSKFVGFYIPDSPKSYEACLSLVNAAEETIKSFQEKVLFRAGYRDESSSLGDLKFSGRVLIYHETFLTIPQKADILREYSAHNFDLNFRGPDYLGDQVISWHRKHDVSK